jgi:membrane protease YdiL (CAAX protease family)
VTKRYRTSRALLGYLLGIILVAAVLSPWVYWAVQGWAEVIHSEWLAQQPFRRVFSRVLIAGALAGLWPLWRALSIRSWSQTGWVRYRGWWRHYLLGYLLGITSLGCAAGLVLWLGYESIHVSRAAADVLPTLGKLMCVACVVAAIEETFFRGVMQATLQAGGSVTVAVMVTSTVYSAVHFMRPQWQKTVHWWSGFDYLGVVLTRSFQGEDTPCGFITLFLAGCILGWAFYRTGMLYLPMGLHAGWVLTNEMFRWLGLGQIRSHLLAWPVLVVVFVLLPLLCRRQPNPPESPS